MKQMKETTELVRRFQSGDKEALGEIYVEQKGYLMTLCNKKFRGYEDYAEDIVQETFLKALEKMKDIRDTESGMSWMSTVANNTGIDMIRKEKKYVQEPSSSREDEDVSNWIEDIPDCFGESDVEGIVIQRESNKNVQLSLGKMDEKSAELLWLHEANKMPLKEMTKRTGLKEGTLKSSLSRARDKFRDIYYMYAA